MIKMGSSQPKPGPPIEHLEGDARTTGEDLLFWEDAVLVGRGVDLPKEGRAQPAGLPHAPSIPITRFQNSTGEGEQGIFSKVKKGYCFTMKFSSDVFSHFKSPITLLVSGNYFS